MKPIHVIFIAVLSGCAAPIGEQAQEPGDLGDPVAESGKISHVRNDDGSTTTTIDASDYDQMVAFAFAQEQEVSVESADWDIGFQRSIIKLNGGVSGRGDAALLVLEGLEESAATVSPASGYQSDKADGDDENDAPDDAFATVAGGWYDYDSVSHTLTAKDHLYIVRSAGKYFRLKILSYYDSAGNSARISFRWMPIDAPRSAVTFVDASADTVYFDVDTASVVTEESVEFAAVWDVAISGTNFTTNGGSSGAGVAGVSITDEPAFEAIGSASTVGYIVDTILPASGAPGSIEQSGNTILSDWYDYDAVNHKATSKGLHYLIRTAAGEYAKLKIENYREGVFTLRTSLLARDVSVQTIEVPANDEQFLSFSQGALRTDIVEPAVDLGWDLSIVGTLLKTNSGTSGVGQGGAVEAMESDFLQVLQVPSNSDFAVDSMRPIPGPPGAGEASGNAQLEGWYDYDAQAHVATARDTVYVLRTADGGYVKLQITDYSDNQYTIDWAYAGAGRNEF